MSTTKPGKLAATVADQHKDMAEAYDEETASSAALLRAVIEDLRPALPAIVSAIGKSQRVTGHADPNKQRIEDDYFDEDGLCLVGNDEPMEDNPRDNRGIYEGFAIYLMADGRFSELTYEGTWSRWQGSDWGWEAKLRGIDDLEAAARWDVADLIEEIEESLRAQLAGRKVRNTKKARKRSNNMRAILQLICPEEKPLLQMSKEEFREATDDIGAPMRRGLLEDGRTGRQDNKMLIVAAVLNDKRGRRLVVHYNADYGDFENWGYMGDFVEKDLVVRLENYESLERLLFAVPPLDELKPAMTEQKRDELAAEPLKPGPYEHLKEARARKDSQPLRFAVVVLVQKDGSRHVVTFEADHDDHEHWKEARDFIDEVNRCGDLCSGEYLERVVLALPALDDLTVLDEPELVEPYDEDEDDEDEDDEGDEGDDERELPISEIVKRDPAACEVLRCWRATGGLEIQTRPYELEPGQWAQAMLYIARNIVAEEDEQTQKKALDAMKEVLDSEWDKPEIQRVFN